MELRAEIGGILMHFRRSGGEDLKGDELCLRNGSSGEETNTVDCSTCMLLPLATVKPTREGGTEWELKEITLVVDEREREGRC